MKFKIVTPERVVYEADDVQAVYANTIDGEVGILPKHIPMVTPLSVGVLRYVKDNQKVPVAVMGGLLRTNGQDVTILADTAELASEIDVARAEQAKTRAENRLKEQNAELDADRANAALKRSMARIKTTQFTV